MTAPEQAIDVALNLVNAELHRAHAQILAIRRLLDARTEDGYKYIRMADLRAVLAEEVMW